MTNTLTPGRRRSSVPHDVCPTSGSDFWLLLFCLAPQEEEDGSEDDAESKPQFSVTDSPNFSMLGFLDQLEDEVDGFISPVDELSPSKNTSDMRLSNLHSATKYAHTPWLGHTV